MSTSRTPPRPATVEYLVAVAKDWTRSCFAAAQSSDFALPAHRFEMGEAGVRRVRLPAGSREASCPLDAVPRVPAATVWSHAVIVTLLADSDTATLDFDQEMVEILAMDGDAVQAEAAPVVRVPGLGACLGPFRVPG